MGEDQWQNIPKEYRQHLAVNGKSVVELEYSNQHPSILYAQEAATSPIFLQLTMTAIINRRLGWGRWRWAMVRMRVAIYVH